MNGKYLVEFLGTFLLVLVIALSKGNALAIGAALVALVFGGGHISGGHFNPAVSVAVWVRGKLAQSEMVMYIGAQILGAVFAELVIQLVTGVPFLAAPAAKASMMGVFLVEFIFTFALAYTVLQVATSNGTKDNQYFGLAIGAVLAAGIFAGGAVSGAVYNPAVAVGPALLQLMSGTVVFQTILTYVVSQLLGGVAAALVFKKTQE